MYTEPQGLLLPHLIWDCNCIYQHFVETKKGVQIFRTFTVFFIETKNYKNLNTIWLISTCPRVSIPRGSILNVTCNIKTDPVEYWPAGQYSTLKSGPGQYLTLQSYPTPPYTPMPIFQNSRFQYALHCTAVYLARLTHIVTLISSCRSHVVFCLHKARCWKNNLFLGTRFNRWSVFNDHLGHNLIKNL